MSARRRHYRKAHVVLVAAAALVLVGGFALEGALARAERDARGALPRLVAEARLGGEPGAVLPGLLEAGAYPDVADVLSAHAEALPTPGTRVLAARASTAAGRYRDAARHTAFASRLSPDDALLDERAGDTATLALLGRLRPVARILALASALVLVVGWLRGARRRRHRRRTKTWLSELEGRVAIGVDGRTFSAGTVPPLPPDTETVVVDVFLRRRGRRRRPPRPGPTLAVVLSHAASSLTLRLRPRHDVREDAVRIRLTDETLARLLGAPGTWRLTAQLGGCVVAETVLEVLPRVPRRRRRRRYLAAYA